MKSLRILAIFVCILAASSGKYPPVQAQRLPPPDSQIQMPSQLAVSPYDPEFASDISGLNKHLEHTDGTLEELKKAMGIQSEDIRELQTNMKWYMWIVGALIGGDMMLPRIRELAKKLTTSE